MEYGGCGLEKDLEEFFAPPPEYLRDLTPGEIEESFPEGHGLVCQQCVDASTQVQTSRETRLQAAQARREEQQGVPADKAARDREMRKLAAKDWRRRNVDRNTDYHLVSAFMARPFPSVEGRRPAYAAHLLESALRRIRKLPPNIPMRVDLADPFDAYKRGEDVGEYQSRRCREYEERNDTYHRTIDMVRGYCREQLRVHEKGGQIINYVEFHARANA